MGPGGHNPNFPPSYAGAPPQVGAFGQGYPGQYDASSQFPAAGAYPPQQAPGYPPQQAGNL